MDTLVSRITSTSFGRNPRCHSGRSGPSLWNMAVPEHIDAHVRFWRIEFRHVDADWEASDRNHDEHADVRTTCAAGWTSTSQWWCSLVVKHCCHGKSFRPGQLHTLCFGSIQHNRKLTRRKSTNATGKCLKTVGSATGHASLAIVALLLYPAHSG